MYKKKWIKLMAEELVEKSIWDSFPSIGKNWTNWQIKEWLRNNKQEFLSYHGGASWDSSVDTMPKDFRKWYDKISELANDGNEQAQNDFDSFYNSVQELFFDFYEKILDEYEILAYKEL